MLKKIYMSTIMQQYRKTDIIKGISFWRNKILKVCFDSIVLVDDPGLFSLCSLEDNYVHDGFGSEDVGLCK